MSLYLQTTCSNYRNQKRQSFRSLIPHRKVDVCHLLFPLVACPCFLGFFPNFEKTTKFPLNLVEDFKVDFKNCFYGSTVSQNNNQNSVLRTL